MIFLVLRQQSATMQALVQVEPELVSKKMVRFCEGITPESIVLVEGFIQKPLELIKSCTVQDAEVKVTQVRLSLSSLFLRFRTLKRLLFLDSRDFRSSVYITVRNRRCYQIG